MTKRCIKCETDKDESEFTHGKNRCKSCINEYNRAYRRKNLARLTANKKDYYQNNKSKIQESVRKAQQRSPEAFLLCLVHHITKKSNYKRAIKGNLNVAALEVGIDYDYLLALYRDQKGRCAILDIPMTHVFNNLRTMSIDRIDSEKGYIPGNVQIVTQFINMAKRHYSNDDVHDVLREFLARRLPDYTGFKG
ncbi:MAG: hypothetical protein V3S81_05625 [Anaerolineales bacterium]